MSTAGQSKQQQPGPERAQLGSATSFHPDSAPQRDFQRFAMADSRSQSHHFEDTKPSTHDFLSLYDKGSQQAENGSSAGLSSSLTTHDFLQPLERNGGRSTYRDGAPAPREKPTVRAESTMQSRHSTPIPGDRMHPGNYTTIQVPYAAVPPNSMIRMVGEAEALRQSRAYPVATLSSREDHSGPESLRGVEVAVDPEAANARENLAYWPGVRFKFGMPSDLTFPAGIPTVKTAVENGHQSMPAMAKQWAQAAQGMLETVPKRPARQVSEEDDDEDEDSSERLKGSRKEAMSQKVDGAPRMDSKNADLRACTPRSKHSATEQRRRSKINDRFQMLRDLVPHSDQKRDKASFLLEVIEYIQVLQDKVRKFENVEQGRHQERLKSMVWDLCKRGAAGSGEEMSQINALVFAKDFGAGGGSPVDIKPAVGAAEVSTAPRVTEAAAPASEARSTVGVNNTTQQGSSRPACSIHSCVSSLEPGEKENAATALIAQPLTVGHPQQAIALPYALPIVPRPVASNSPAKEKLSSDPDTVSSLENSGYNQGYARAATPDHQFQVRPRFSLASSQADQMAGQQQSKAEPQRSVATFNGAHQAPSSSAPRQAPLSQEKQARPSQHDTPGDGSAASPSQQPSPRIQGGVINVSSVYSQGLLDTLTRALQSSGVDLSKANISVQIDLGQNATVAAADTSVKVATTPESSAQSHQSQGRTRPSPMTAEPEPALKRPKVESH